MEKIFIESDASSSKKKQYTLILQQSDLRDKALVHGEMNLKELSIDMLTRFDFTVNPLEYEKATNVIYIAPTGQIKVLKHRKPVLK